MTQHGLQEWSPEIELMINEHHKLTKYKDDRYPLVEIFRQGDLVDFSLGMFKFGLSMHDIQQVKIQFPNAGFHKRLAQLAGQWFTRHPFTLPPFMKW